MKKDEFIAKYGIEAYKRLLVNTKQWCVTHPKRKKAQCQEQCRKGGKHYEYHNKQYRMTGVPHKKLLIRSNHGRIWKKHKQIIAPESQLHHQWLPETANYTGMALVEKEQHQYGFIDVIQILEGGITLFTETEIRGAVR